MINSWQLAIAISIFSTLISPSALAQACENAGDPAEVESIRAQRQSFNLAIAESDTHVLPTILHEEVILITGTDSDVYQGRAVQTDLWQEDFENADRAIYVRTSVCIRVSPILPVALESGSWRGVRINNADAYAAGQYSAKWRKVDDVWLLESEIFATEECGGDFCPSQSDAQ